MRSIGQGVQTLWPGIMDTQTDKQTGVKPSPNLAGGDKTKSAVTQELSDTSNILSKDSAAEKSSLPNSDEFQGLNFPPTFSSEFSGGRGDLNSVEGLA